MNATFKFAQGPLPFYDPADAMFYLPEDEAEAFRNNKSKGAPIGLFVLLIGLAIIGFGSGIIG